MIKRFLDRLRNIDWHGLLRRSPRVIGPVVFGMVVYVVTLAIAFPYQRVADFAEAWGSTKGYDLKIGDVGPTFGFGVKFSNVKITSMTSSGDAHPTTAVIDSARVTTNPLANLSGVSYGFSADAFGGAVDGDIKANTAEGRGSIDLKDV